MKSLFPCLVLALAATACDWPEKPKATIRTPEAQAPAPSRRALPEYLDVRDFESCGGEVRPGAVKAYFERLESHLESSSDPIPLEFYSQTVSITHRGRWLWFRVTDLGPRARQLPSRADWREVSRHGAAGVFNAGWRGCAQSSGKVWFESNENGEMGLKGFNKDMDWTD
jgi:hypothetical protein